MPGIRRGIALSVAILLGPVLGALAQTPEASPMEKALDRLEKALEKEQALSPDTLEALQAVVRALREERRAQAPEIDKGEIARVVDEYLAASPPSPPETPQDTFMDRFTPYGDLRLRHESDFQLDTRPDRSRERIRLRLGGNYRITDRLTAGGRVVTGSSGDPNSSHQTLGRVFDSFEISLDRAFVTYRPEWAEGVRGTVGKFGHPFYANPVFGELVWDGDVQPEGLVLGFTRTDLGRLERFDAFLGEYIVLEQGRAEEAFATVFQTTGRFRLTDDLKATLAVGYYHYTDPTPDDSLLILAGDNAGNIVLDRNLDGIADHFASDFGILNPIMALSYDGWKLPLILSAEYIKNLRAHGGEDQGWALGVALGSTKEKGSWRYYYQWQVVERDAVFSAVAQDDFLFSTNHRSHIFGIMHQFTDKVQAHLWSLVSRRDNPRHFFTGGTGQDQWRLRLDLNLKF